LAERLPAAPTAVEACAAAVAAFLGTVATRVARCYWRARRQDWRLQDWRPQISRLRLIIVGLILADAAIIGWRTDLVWVMPQTASFYAELGLPVNVRGVQFEAITAAAERHDGEPVLIVKGEIGNGTNTVQAVPHLRFAVRNLQRQEIYSWTATPARGSLAPGETLAFRSELVLPPPNTRDVVVRFADRDASF
jgi:hypothetical protein